MWLYGNNNISWANFLKFNTNTGKDDTVLQIMEIEPGASVWKRNRPLHHGGAVRSYTKESDDDGYPRGPDASPRICPDCNNDSQYKSASPASCYLSSDERSPIFLESQKSSTFDMKRKF